MIFPTRPVSYTHLSNILENSLKYKDKETITVKVSLKAAPSGCSMTLDVYKRQI